MGLESAFHCNYWAHGMGISIPRSPGKSRDLLTGAGDGGSSLCVCGFKLHFPSRLWVSYSLSRGMEHPALMQEMHPREGMLWGKSHPPRADESRDPTICTQELSQEQGPALLWIPRPFPLLSSELQGFCAPRREILHPWTGCRRTRESWGERESRNKQI